MSDTPQGGWWKANDGKWYPPETHPDHGADAGPELPAGPPAAGWWQASDGNWYPPETRPDATPTIDLTGSDHIDLGRSEQADAVLEESGTWNLTPGQDVAGNADVMGRDESGTWDLTPGSSIDVADPSPVVEEITVEPGGDGLADVPAAAEVGADADLSVVPPLVAPAPEDPASAETPEEPEVVQPPITPPTWDPTVDEATRPSLFSPPVATPNGNGASTSLNGSSAPVVDGGSAEWGADPFQVPESPAQPPAPEPAQFSIGAPLDLTPLSPSPVVDEPAVDDPDAPLPGWHKGADGAWYPPGQEAPRPSVFPNSARSEPSVLTPAAAPAPAKGGRSKLPLILAGVGALVILAVLAGVLLLGGGDDGPAAGESAEDAATATTAAPTTVPTTSIPAPPPPQASGEVSGTVDMGRNVTDQYLALITHDGAGPFSARLVGADGEVSQELVGLASGQYLGVVMVNAEAGQAFRSVEADASGAWAVTFALVESAPGLPSQPGAVYDGSGDEVLRVALDRDTTVRFACSACDGEASVVGWSAGEQTISESVDASGVIGVPAATSILQVRVPAEGSPVDWSITVQ